MQWLIDLVIEAIGIPPTFIDRGDPAVNDFTQADLITDGTWHDLDLSGIVPAGASAVALFVRIRDDVADPNIRFRKKGNINSSNVSIIYSQVANLNSAGDCIVVLDNNRFIQYHGGPAVLTSLIVNVKGWWL